MELTIRHESIHNFLDGARDVKHYDSQAFSREVGVDAVKQPVDETIIQPDQLQAYLDRTNVNEYLDGLHHELLAGMERAERETFPEDRPVDVKFQWIEDFFHYATRYSTAGRHAWDFYKELQKIEENIPEGKTQMALREFQMAFMKRFAETIETIRTCVERAQALGDPALERAHAMFMVLPPSKYRHVSRYLDSLESQAA